nr:unnamed protein product [Digitaria exilis]
MLGWEVNDALPQDGRSGPSAAVEFQPNKDSFKRSSVASFTHRWELQLIFLILFGKIETFSSAMVSFGMNWNQKNLMVWNCKNLATSVPNDIARHGSMNTSGGTLTSSSELGHGSSKSSISASIDSPYRVGNSLEFNFAAVEKHVKDMGKNDRADNSRSSPPSMIAFSHGEPSISLKLGKRAYFENVCGRQDGKSSAPSTVTSASTVVKKTKVSQQNAQNSYCQVEGCKVDLSSAKAYHRKHKVCEVHAKAPKVVVADTSQQTNLFFSQPVFGQISSSVASHTHHHNLNGLMPFKGANTKVLNQGVEASATASTSNAAPELGRALSLLSDGSWGSSSTVIQQHSSHVLTGGMPRLANAAVSTPAMNLLNPSPGGFWHDDSAPLDGTLQIQASAHL